jgi:hypothetical protein
LAKIGEILERRRISQTEKEKLEIVLFASAFWRGGREKDKVRSFSKNESKTRN